MSFITVNASKSTGRRQFLKSLFGLGSVLPAAPADARDEVKGSFYWADLATGQVGFPTGATVARGLPGSLMKVVAAAAIRDGNLLPADQTFECNGRVVVKKVAYHCQVPHGRVTLTQALGHSCNVFFAQASEFLSGRSLMDYAAQFGLKVEVAGFASGLFPDNVPVDSTEHVLGLARDLQPQGLQLLRMAALVGSGGDLPYLHSAENPDPGAARFRLTLSDDTWSVLRQGMRIAAREGTARKLDPEDRLKLAVKTGTAPHGQTFQSWVAGYFPFDAPRHAFLARALSGTSQDQAVPLARRYLLSTTWP